MSGIFQLDDEDVKRLGARPLHQVLRRLLLLECDRLGLPPVATSVSLEINVPDGGQDGFLGWKEGPEAAGYIPARLTLFQCKACDLEPRDCYKELWVKVGKKLKPRIETVLDAGGTYVLFTTAAYVDDEKDRRLKEMRRALSEAGRADAESADLRIYDAGVICAWANQYLAAVMEIARLVGKLLPIQGLSVDMWASGEDMRTPPVFVADDLRKQAVADIQSAFSDPNEVNVVRVTGLSGLGKTRLVLEAIKTATSSPGLNTLEASCVYFPLHSDRLYDYIPVWLAQGIRALIVVDECSPEQHQRLSKLIRAQSSKLGLITVDYDETPVPRVLCVHLREMDTDKIRDILRATHPSLGDSDSRRLAEFSDGFPAIAALLADTQLAGAQTISQLPDEELVKRLVLGRARSGNVTGNTLWEALRSLAVFTYVGFAGEAANELQLAAQALGVDLRTVHQVIKQQLDRGIVQAKGNYVRVTPRPLAIHLAAQWWRDVWPHDIDKVMSEFPAELIERMCDQLKTLHHLKEAQSFVARMCAGPFAHEEILTSARGSRIFLSLVEVDPHATIACLVAAFGSKSRDELLEVQGDGRRNLIWALERLAWWEDTFPKAAGLLLSFAEAETETWANNATNQFVQLFQVPLSGTQAPYRLRWPILESALRSPSRKRQSLAIKALGRALATSQVHRTGGVESQGGRLPGKDWMPKTYGEWRAIMQTAVSLLREALRSSADLGAEASAESLERVHYLAQAGLWDAIKAIVTDVTGLFPHLRTAALEKVESIIEFGVPDEAADKMIAEELLSHLRPRTLEERIEQWVKAPSFHFTYRKEGETYVDIAHREAVAIADEIGEQVGVVETILPLVIRGEARKGASFGAALVARHPNIPLLVEQSLAVMVDSPDLANPSFLSGVLKELRRHDPLLTESTLDKMARSSVLVKWLVEVTCMSDPTPQSLRRIIRLVETGVLSAASMRTFLYGAMLSQWSVADIHNLADQLRDLGPEGALVALELTYQYGQVAGHLGNETIRGVIADLVRAAKLTATLGDSTTPYHYQQAVVYLLSNGINVVEHVLGEIINMLTDHENERCWSHWEHSFTELLRELLKVDPIECWERLGTVFLADSLALLEFSSEFQDRHAENAQSENSEPGLTDYLPADYLLSWCERHLPDGPRKVAQLITVFDSRTNTIHPTAHKLLAAFGEDPKVGSALWISMDSFASWGSRVPYLQRRLTAVQTLKEQTSSNAVVAWAQKVETWLYSEIERERHRDEEDELRFR